MKELTKAYGGIYYVKLDDGDFRIWHNCKKYKDRDEARVEMERQIDNDIIANYKCLLCDFTYDLDKQLNL